MKKIKFNGSISHLFHTVHYSEQDFGWTLSDKKPNWEYMFENGVVLHWDPLKKIIQFKGNDKDHIKDVAKHVIPQLEKTNKILDENYRKAWEAHREQMNKMKNEDGLIMPHS